MNRKKRVAICPYTKKEVVQVEDGDDWLCLHEATEAEEAEQVRLFKINQKQQCQNIKHTEFTKT